MKADSITASRQRQIEWWSVLNALRRPKDMPANFTERELFNHLTVAISKRERMDFWNGAFECGKQAEKYL
jgi:hypothetical protein